MKKLIFAFAIMFSGMFMACNNHSTKTTEDSVVTDTVVTDSCICDTCICDTVPSCNQ